MLFILKNMVERRTINRVKHNNFKKDNEMQEDGGMVVTDNFCNAEYNGSNFKSNGKHRNAGIIEIRAKR